MEKIKENKYVTRSLILYYILWPDLFVTGKKPKGIPRLKIDLVYEERTSLDGYPKDANARRIVMTEETITTTQQEPKDISLLSEAFYAEGSQKPSQFLILDNDVDLSPFLAKTENMNPIEKKRYAGELLDIADEKSQASGVYGSFFVKVASERRKEVEAILRQQAPNSLTYWSKELEIVRSSLEEEYETKKLREAAMKFFLDPSLPSNLLRSKALVIMLEGRATVETFRTIEDYKSVEGSIITKETLLAIALRRYECGEAREGINAIIRSLFPGSKTQKFCKLHWT